MIWGTTSYAAVPDPDVPGASAWAESHRDLTDAELPAAVYAVEVSTTRGTSYASNGLRWSDPADARRWAVGLSMRWFAATDIRVVRVSAPVADQTTAYYDLVEVVEQVL